MPVDKPFSVPAQMLQEKVKEHSPYLSLSYSCKVRPSIHGNRNTITINETIIVTGLVHTLTVKIRGLVHNGRVIRCVTHEATLEYALFRNLLQESQLTTRTLKEIIFYEIDTAARISKKARNLTKGKYKPRKSYRRKQDRPTKYDTAPIRAR